jgi:rhodanese-related sulfurtransferase
MQTILPKELTSLLETSPDSIDLIDVRGTGEYSEAHIPEAKNIPLHLLPMRLSELDKKKKIIFICRSGGRSGQACGFAWSENITAYNLVGWMNDFESEFPKKVVHGEKKKLFGLF